MDNVNPRLGEIFYEVQRGLPRQGPGNNESTRRALALCTDLSDKPAVLDIGCGPGMQTIALATALAGQVVAVDNCKEYLSQLREEAERASVIDRVVAKTGDMAKLDFPSESFDLIWCEGAAYILGIREALTAWRPLLRSHGYLAFTELVWLDDSPPAEVLAFFKEEYPAMTTVRSVSNVIRECRYQPVADFTVPDSAWWDDYYTPLSSKLPPLKEKYAKDDDALKIIAMTETEIDMRRRYAGSYGYHFFVARRDS